jgi:hypothetical protein
MGLDLGAEGRGDSVEVEGNAAIVHRHLAAFARVMRVADTLRRHIAELERRK